jgi:hypothetical protein
MGNHGKILMKGNPHEPTMMLKMLDLIKLSDIYMRHAPNHEKHALCKQIRNAQYELYATIIECVKRYHKKTTLVQLDINHEVLRGMYRLYYELGYFQYPRNKKNRTEAQARKRYRAISTYIDELGRMIGGWLNYEKSRNK